MELFQYIYTGVGWEFNNKVSSTTRHACMHPRSWKKHLNVDRSLWGGKTSWYNGEQWRKTVLLKGQLPTFIHCGHCSNSITDFDSDPHENCTHFRFLVYKISRLIPCIPCVSHTKPGFHRSSWVHDTPYSHRWIHHSLHLKVELWCKGMRRCGPVRIH